MRWMWIDRIVELTAGERLVAVKNVSLAEDHLHDHFPAGGPHGAPADAPALPVMPASLIIEGLAQSAGILVGHARGFREKVILAKIGRFEIERDATPGDTLRYTVTLDRIDDAGAATTGIIELIEPGAPGMRTAEQIGHIELMFSHIDQNMAGLEFPEENFVFCDAFRTLLRTSGIDADF